MSPLLRQKEARLKALRKIVDRLVEVPTGLIAELLVLEEQVAELKAKEPNSLEQIGKWFTDTLDEVFP